MIQIPERFRKLISQAVGFLFVVSSTLFANWVWQKYTAKIDLEQIHTEERQFFLKIVRKVIQETEYNCTEGIGDEKCPFELAAHHELLATSLSDSLPNGTYDLVKAILRMASLCNGGRMSRKAYPGLVKAKSLELREALTLLTQHESFVNLQ